ncbi:MAG: putative lipid II flippase FtsW [Candidatus Limnocylindrales bacterium]
MKPASVALPAPRTRAGAEKAATKPVAGRAAARGRSRTVNLKREVHAPDGAIMIAALALTALGILMVYSSSGVQAYIVQADSLAGVGPQFVWAGLGIVAMLAAMRLDYRFWRYASTPLFAVAMLLLVIVLLPGVGTVIGGSARWLKIGPLPAVHPAEFAKLALIVYLAHWMASRGPRISSVLHGTLPFLLLAAPMVVLVLREPDLGTAAVLTLTALTLFFVAGANLWQFLLFVPAGAAAVAFVVVSHAYQLQRVLTFLDPWKDAHNDGFHTVQGLLALGLGGLVGEGLGPSPAGGGLALPNASNDFIFAVVGQQFGLIGGLTVIGLFVIIAWQGARVALLAPDTFGGLLAIGVTAWISLQAFVNMAVVVNLLPVTGITLPFVSDGGSSLMVSFAAVGILLSVSRETKTGGTWNDADPHRRRWFRRAHPAGPGRRPVAARAARRP